MRVELRSSAAPPPTRLHPVLLQWEKKGVGPKVLVWGRGGSTRHNKPWVMSSHPNPPTLRGWTYRNVCSKMLFLVQKGQRVNCVRRKNKQWHSQVKYSHIRLSTAQRKVQPFTIIWPYATIHCKSEVNISRSAFPPSNLSPNEFDFSGEHGRQQKAVVCIASLWNGKAAVYQIKGKEEGAGGGLCILPEFPTWVTIPLQFLVLEVNGKQTFFPSWWSNRFSIIGDFAVCKVVSRASFSSLIVLWHGWRSICLRQTSFILGYTILFVTEKSLLCSDTTFSSLQLTGELGLTYFFRPTVNLIKTQMVI